MKKIIVSTTINDKTPAIELFDHMDGWDLIMVGDLKTPKHYKLDKGLYLCPDDQVKLDHSLSDAIGWNTIQRRNFGFLFALKSGADIIATVDDDNVPLPNWGQNLYLDKPTEVDFYETDLPCFDPVSVTDYPHLWHRGFPLQLLNQRTRTKKTKKTIVPSVQADFWNGDPDIDAVCRMEHAPDCKFDPSSFPFSSDRMGPFNSQNTFLTRQALRDYFLFPHSGRMDDIWASFYVQSLGHKVVYAEPSVTQIRNEHDLTLDLSKEVIGYENNLRLVQDLQQDTDSIQKYLSGRTLWAWNLYQKHLRGIE